MGTILEAEDVFVGQTEGPTLMEQFFVFFPTGGKQTTNTDQIHPC